ncbi:hypothetical protein AHAS_Ahas03G0208900 [Arachis hypogaea]
MDLTILKRRLSLASFDPWAWNSDFGSFETLKVEKKVKFEVFRVERESAKSLPDPSLAPFDPKIERTLTHIRQARLQLAFVDSELGLVEEHTNSLPPSTRDHHSSKNEETLYSSVGSAEISLSESGDSTTADPPRRITLREAGAPDINLQPLQIQYLALDLNFELKTDTINLLPKYNGLPEEDPLKNLKDFQVACSTARRHAANEAAVLVFTFPFSLEGKAKEWFYTQPENVISNGDLLRMNPQDKLLLDASSGGSLTKNKTAEEAWEIIADLADSTQHSRARNPQPKALSEVSPSGYAILTRTLMAITPISALNSKRTLHWRWNQAPQAQPYPSQQAYYHQAPQGQPQYQQSNPQPPQSQPQRRYQHPNSRSNCSQGNQGPPPNQPYMNDTLQAFMHEQQEFHKKQDAYMATIAEALSHLTFSPLTTQNSQQASTSSGLPSQPQPNPKGNITLSPLGVALSWN